jgi:hypothetical protein
VKLPPAIAKPVPARALRPPGTFSRLPAVRIYWMAGGSAVVIAAVVLGILAVANLYRSATNSASNHHESSQTTRSGPATPDWVSKLPFNCLGSTSIGIGSTIATAYVDAAAVGTHTGYDRVTLQFTEGPPAETSLNTQSGATFTDGSSGQPVTLKGQNGALVTLHSTDGHSHYGGQPDITTTYPVVLELRKVQDFEGTLQWAIGLAKLPCYRMAFLDRPTRLVIDFRASSPGS